MKCTILILYIRMHIFFSGECKNDDLVSISLSTLSHIKTQSFYQSHFISKLVCIEFMSNA